MKERPIIFSGPMVKAILAGGKTQTRRPLKPQPVFHDDLPEKVKPYWTWNIKNLSFPWSESPAFEIANYGMGDHCPYGKPGDLLWVRETWAKPSTDYREREWHSIRTHEVVYAADEGKQWFAAGGNYTQHNSDFRWHPSIHMPRWASRITLRITDVRVQTVQEISNEDAEEELGDYPLLDHDSPLCRVHYPVYNADSVCCEPGYCECGDYSYTENFAALWDTLYAGKPFAWEKNPWVWVVSFERVLEAKGEVR